MRAFSMALIVSIIPLTAQAAEMRCGWFYNPSPANAYFMDKDGEWTIGVQGGFQAEGDWPEIGEQVVVNRNKGYGCTCAVVETAEGGYITKIISSEPRTLEICRADPLVAGQEPEVPGPQ